MAYKINYNDDRFKEVESDKKEALSDLEKTYSDMIGNSDKYYQAQIDASKEWADTQSKNQQAQTDFAIEQVEQQKAQAEKDYLKEQSGAYADWQKESNRYGVNAEQMATDGLAHSGYAESSQVSLYNTYQNRVATARESYQKALLNYDNNIKEAKLQNSKLLADIAFEALQKELELSLQGFQYENQLLLDKLAQKNATEDRYYNRWQDVLNQMNTENALQEDLRQFNASHELQKEQLKQQKEIADAQLAEEKRQFNAQMAVTTSQISASTTGSSRSSSGSSGSGGSIPVASQKVNANATGSGALKTEYYSGEYNPDGKTYGTFSNGYQPKGIDGYGKVSKTGETIEVSTQTLSGKKQILVQNVWQTPDGSKWYWEGRENRYIRLSLGKGSSAQPKAAVR